MNDPLKAEPLKIGVAGLGTVGAGVIKILKERAGFLADASGRTLVLGGVSARDRAKDRGIDIRDVRWFDDAREMAKADDLDVIVELIGGSEGVAREVVELALAHGKHVVTANKALIAHHGLALGRLAEEKGVSLNYEAAVAGGIPIIKALREGLAANEITSVVGILNGTCNYILTEMEKTGRDFTEVLADAQALGYAEADPSFDVGGIDAAHKLAILASLAFGVQIDFGGVHIEGIERVTATDISFAREFGYRIKLLGVARKTEAGIEQRVHPALVPDTVPLANVMGVFNAVAVEGDRVGQVVLEGRGAGEGPTASAVLSDLIDIARGFIVPPFIVPTARLAPSRESPADTHLGRYFLSLAAADRAGSMAAITRALADEGVSIERMIQRGAEKGATDRLPVVFITHETQEGTMQRALAQLMQHQDVAGTPLMLRVEGETR
ncbi:MAG: homoserine dehydrogenase [Parvibaculaceae bacterium]|nr:homoserine dehydrogenase [Parvibaculaceae bacterium]